MSIAQSIQVHSSYSKNTAAFAEQPKLTIADPDDRPLPAPLKTPQQSVKESKAITRYDEVPIMSAAKHSKANNDSTYSL